jgi:hypothetical protein
MAVQRNNVTRLPWALREVVYRLLFEGATGDAVRAEIKRLDASAPTPWDGSLQAIRERDPHYKQYVERRMGLAPDQARRRANWAATDDGSAETGLRAARYLVLSSMVEALEDGNELPPADLARLASGLKALQDDLLTKLRDEHRAEIARLTGAHAAKAAADAAEIAGLREELARLRNDGREVDPAAVAERMNEVLGVKKA